MLSPLWTLVALTFLIPLTASKTPLAAPSPTTNTPNLSAPFAAVTPTSNASHPRFPRAIDHFTINIYTKSHVPGLHIRWPDNPGVPGAISNVQNKPLGSSTRGIFPTGWAGRIAVGRDPDQGVINRGSLIEASFVGRNSYDVSYVQGYSVPIVCSCQGIFNAGCSIPLFWGKTKCPSLGPSNTCYNPLNNSPQGRDTAAQAFFEPCQGAAMVYPNDYAGIQTCAVNEISCCVGHGCPPAKQQHQKMKRAIGGHVRAV